MGPRVLAQVLRDLSEVEDGETRLLTNLANSDAGAYRLDKRIILLQNVDFVTPLVNTSFEFGSIAAANALSDIYAMGGTPITALNVLGYPSGALEAATVNEVLKGGLDKIREAGALLVGGHTVDNEELIYGLCVTGVVSSQHLVRNSTSQIGDALVLTKPVGSTLVAVAFARDFGVVDKTIAKASVECMALLNKYAAGVMRSTQVNACTDISGFGFLGHLWELCSTSKVAVVIESEKIMCLPGSLDLIKAGFASSARSRNREHLLVEHAVELASGVDEDRLELLYEAETSGGLLISVPSAKAADLVSEINKRQGGNYAHTVGCTVAGPACIHLK